MKFGGTMGSRCSEECGPCCDNDDSEVVVSRQSSSASYFDTEDDVDNVNFEGGKGNSLKGTEPNTRGSRNDWNLSSDEMDNEGRRSNRSIESRNNKANVVDSQVSSSVYERHALKRINWHRAAHNVDKLQANSYLKQLAQRHCEQISRDGKSSYLPDNSRDMNGNLVGQTMDVSFDEDVFNKCEQEYENDLKMYQGIPGDNTAFRFAVCLIEHPNIDEVKRGVNIMRPLYEHTDSDLREQILFYLAKAEYRLKHYATAKVYCEEMLRIKPNWYQAQTLLNEINKAVKKDGMLGLLTTGGLLAFTGVIGTALTFAIVKMRGKGN